MFAFKAAAVGLLFLATLARADDGALTAGGAPGLVQGHPSVSMKSERVVVTIDGDNTSVDCTFIFHNDGPACDVRMGFPDIASGANETAYDERMAEAKSKGRTIPPYQGLNSFTSWVDGKRISTKLIRGSNDVSSWHEKTVHFAASQTRTVRDHYRTPAGTGQTTVPGSMKETMYVMFTGASWHNTIGDVDVLIQFRGFPKITPYPNSGEQKMTRSVLQNRGTVLCDGFTKPTVGKNWLRFRAKNLKPKESDNVYIRYSWNGPPK